MKRATLKRGFVFLVIIISALLILFPDIEITLTTKSKNGSSSLQRMHEPTFPEGTPSLTDLLKNSSHPGVGRRFRKILNPLLSKYNNGTPTQQRTLENWWSHLANGNVKTCKQMERVGGSTELHVEGRDDGGKWMCFDYPLNIVYSLGSRGDFSFERELLMRFGSSVFTFDCTMGRQKIEVPMGVQFFPWCLGDKDEVKNIGRSRNLQFYSLKTIMSKLKHDKIDLLKMDIEGSEYEIFPDLAHLDVGDLPHQILFELHIETLFAEHASRVRKSVKLLTLISPQKYKIFHVEPNVLCPLCCEFSIML